ncbi:MAG: hypothetical protein ABFS86_03345 [Planctomycetota bacterium]
MFVGTHRRTLDEKWRLPLPSDLFAPAYRGDRDNLYFAIMAGDLILFTSEWFEEISQRLLKKSVVAEVDVRRLFFGNTYAKVRDKNGRIQVPEPLRAKVGFSAKDELEIVGTGQYAELRKAPETKEELDPQATYDIFAALDALGGSE